MTPSRSKRIATGPEMIRAGRAIATEQRRRDEWPFPHVYPPVSSIRRDPTGFILAPAIGALNQAVVLAFQVPQGFYFFMRQLGLYYVGDATGNQPGAFTFSVDVDTPLGGGALQGSPLADWSSIGFQFGSVTVGPYHLPRAEAFAPSRIIRAKVVNNSVTVPGTNTFCAVFGGYLVSEDEWRDA